jgi:hypothetical protein
MNKLAPYRKTITALAVALLGWATAVVTSPSGPITPAEWITLAGAVLAAAGVYSVSNAPAEPVVTGAAPKAD